MSAILVRTNYNELLRKIEKLKDVDKGFQNRLREIVVALRDVSNGLKEISREYSYEQNETEVWGHYRQIQKERFSLLNILHEWKIVWIPSLHKEFNHLIAPIQNALDELISYVTALMDTLRAHVEVLEIQNSRENRKTMRKLSFMALLVSVVIPYITLWQGFARELILNLTFPWGLSPHLNWVILFILLVPLAWALGRGWRYLTQEDVRPSTSACMSLAPEVADRLEYETLRDRLATREESTLVFSTVTASASLVILSFLENRSISESYFLLGILFTLVGIMYREATIFSIDRVESKRMRQLEYKLIGRRIPRPSLKSLILRRFLVPFFLWIALSAWLVAYSLPLIPTILLVGVLPPLVLAVLYDP